MGRSQKIIFIALTALLAAALVLLGAAVYQKRNADSSFVKPPFEAQAVAGVPQISDASLRYHTLEIDQGFHVSLCVNLSLNAESGKADIYFTSAADNTVWSRVVLLDTSGVQLGASGLLRPGEYVQSVALEKIPQSSGSMVAKILSYEPETYYSMGTASAEIYLQIK